MNLGKDARKAFKQQQPTYHVAPNLTTRPYPDGPLELGTIVEDIKSCYPINQGAENRVPIPQGQRYTESKMNLNATLKTSSGGKVSLIAKVFDRSVGSDLSLKGKKGEEDVYKIERLETVYFYPQPSYIRRCLELSDVRDYQEMGDYKEPVYLITGLKLAWGTTISMRRGTRHKNSFDVGMLVPGPLDLVVGAKAAVAADAVKMSSFEKPADFVLGVQVVKLYHKRKLFTNERTLTTERVIRRAVLVDNDDPESADEESAENFVIAELNDEDREGVTAWVENEEDALDE